MGGYSTAKQQLRAQEKGSRIDESAVIIGRVRQHAIWAVFVDPVEGAWPSSAPALRPVEPLGVCIPAKRRSCFAHLHGCVRNGSGTRSSLAERVAEVLYRLNYVAVPVHYWYKADAALLTISLSAACSLGFRHLALELGYIAIPTKPLAALLTINTSPHPRRPDPDAADFASQRCNTMATMIMSQHTAAPSASAGYPAYLGSSSSSSSSSSESSCYYASSSSSPSSTPPPLASAPAAALQAATMVYTHPPEESLPFVVLVVDDNAINRKVLTIPLRKQGIQVVEAENGLEAVQMYAQVRPALVLMDISMPVMDGFEATRQIRMHEQAQSATMPDIDGEGAGVDEVVNMLLTHQRARIVAATTHSADRDFAEGKDAGMDDWLLKPIRPSTLVKDILEFRRNHLQDFAATLAALATAPVSIAAGEAAMEMVLDQASTPTATTAALAA
ncbi:response regulator [Moesziomyces antarcticus]|uniref:Response regulator n=2 Tax=Pseudozyma antarctica TaxID=84753 RepID=A0A081CK17_PSEA2|nr:response regulator [Moesziomyces antarcticus]GAK67013.1 response regulator [Moesziomyces antarcticus]